MLPAFLILIHDNQTFLFMIPDQQDKAIMRLLQKDARMTIREIADQVGMSSTPVFERIKKLEKAGFIEGYVALLNQELLGYKMVAFVQISLSLHNRYEVNSFVERVTVFPEVMECYHTTGDSDFILKIRSEEHTSELQSRGHLVC